MCDKDQFVCTIRTKTIEQTLFFYVEFLCEYDQTSNKIKLVSHVLNKEAKNVKSIETEFLNLQVLNSHTDLYELQKPFKASRDLVWLVGDDFTPRGGFKPENVEDKPVYFDTVISTTDSLKVLRHKHDISQLLHCNIEPLALYHGSGADKRELIIKQGLKLSFGMLGDAVYLGTFFKACRYASRQQNYEFRNEGVIFRCLAFALPTKTKQYPLQEYACTCKKCTEEKSGFEKVSDHFAQWNGGPFSCAEVLVSYEPFGFKKGGEPKYLCKNAEWAFRPENVLVQEFLNLDLSTVWSPHYHPLQRNCKCFW